MTALDPEVATQSGRATSPAPTPAAGESLERVLEATRGLLWIKSAEDAHAAARDLVEGLGGTLVATDKAGAGALSVDVSFGVGEPLLPSAPLASVARTLLELHIPGFVRDANRALELVNQAIRLAQDASIDILTGLPNRRMLGRVLGRIDDGDIVILIDLDYFKKINDTFGHDEGDRVLRAFGGVLLDAVRAKDRVGRYGGEEFVVILSEHTPEQFLTRLESVWIGTRPRPITFSAGAARAGSNPRRALEAADRAMYRAKELGRDQWQWAVEEDYA